MKNIVLFRQDLFFIDFCIFYFAVPGRFSFDVPAVFIFPFQALFRGSVRALS